MTQPSPSPISAPLSKLVGDLLAPMAGFELADANTKRDFGGVFFRERVTAVATLAMQHVAGDVLEIGVYNGLTACMLARAALDCGRRYLGIDNFLPHPDYHHDRMEPLARAAVAPFSNAEIVKIDAHSEEGVALVKSRAWAFALSDDGHEYEHHRCELNALLSVVKRGVICVDDVYVPDAKRAGYDAIYGHAGWSVVSFDGLREMYLAGDGG